MPWTFSYRDTHTGARFYCELCAKVDRPGFFTDDFRYIWEVFVYAALHEPIKALYKQKDSQVTYLCCSPKGTVSLNAAINKNAFKAGETVTLNLTVDNNLSEVNFEAM